MPEIPSTGSSLTIEELTSRPGAKPRVVVLLGGGLPLMGAEWGSKLIMQTKWYPGNNTEATQHVLVATEVPSAWEGLWRRTVMSRQPSLFTDDTGETLRVFDPHLLREVLEDIHRSAARLRVTWAVSGSMILGEPGLSSTFQHQDVRIVREGRISDFSTPIDRHTDIRWKMTFEWMSRGGRQDRVARVRSDQDLDAIANAFQASADAFATFQNQEIFLNKKDILRSADKFTLGKLESIANFPTQTIKAYGRIVQQNLSQLKKAGEIARKFRQLPDSIKAQVETIGTNIRAAADNFQDDLGRSPPEIYSRKPGAVAVTRAATLVFASQDAARDNADKADALASAIRKTRTSGGNRGVVGAQKEPRQHAGDVLAIHVCHAGDTPQTVSRRYYQSTEHGVDILRANRMPWHTPSFVPGTVLVIPAIANRTAV